VLHDAEPLGGAGGLRGTATDDNGRRVELRLNDKTVYHQGANSNLLGVRALTDKGNVVHLEKGNSYILLKKRGENGRAKIPMEERNGLFIVKLEHVASPERIRDNEAKLRDMLDDQTDGPVANMAELASLDTWHRRLNHIPTNKIKVMFDKGTFEGLDVKGMGRGCVIDTVRVKFVE